MDVVGSYHRLVTCIALHTQLVGGSACGFAAWALYDGRGSESAAGRAGLCALGAWAGVLAAGALAALAGAARGSASLLAAAFALLALSGVAEGAAAWWGAAHVPQLRAALRDELARAVRADYGRVASRTQVLDAIQHGVSEPRTRRSPAITVLIHYIQTIPLPNYHSTECNLSIHKLYILQSIVFFHQTIHFDPTHGTSSRSYKGCLTKCKITFARHHGYFMIPYIYTY